MSEATCKVGEDVVGPYVLGTLTPEEARAFEEHAALCVQCTDEMADFFSVIKTLDDAITPVDPPQELRARILGAVALKDSGAQGAVLVPPATGPSRLQGTRRNVASPSFGVGRGLALAAAVILAFALGHAVATPSATATPADLADAAIASGAHVTVLTPASGTPLSAALVAPLHGAESYLIFSSGAPLPKGHVYALWYIGRGAQASTVRHVVDISRSGTFAITSPSSATGEFAISNEPHVGDTHPLGPVIMTAMVGATG